MLGHFKKYTLFLLCSALLNAALFSPVGLNAQPKVSSHNKTVQSDKTQKSATQTKKPTFKESWRKVVTLRWKELDKADAWNIGAPVITGLAALSLFYYSGVTNVNTDGNTQNPDDNNPGGGTGITIHKNGLNPDLPNNSIPQPHQLLVPKQHKKITRLGFVDGEIVIPDDIQNKIALDIITDFLTKPIRLQGENINDVTSVAISGNKIIIGYEIGTVKIWNINDGTLHHTLQAPFSDIAAISLFQGDFSSIQSITIKDNNVITASEDSVIRIYDINTGKAIRIIDDYRDRIYPIKNNNTVIIASEEDLLPTNPTLEHVNGRWSVQINNNKVIGTHNGIVEIFPLSADLNAPEFNQDPAQHAPSWIKHNLLPMQANLIARATTESQAGNPFIITINTDDAHIWITLPAHVRDYLVDRLNIQLQR